MQKMFHATFRKKLVGSFSIILIVATVIVGLSSYVTAKNALDEKGKQILRNSVHQAMDLIKSHHEQVMNGSVSMSVAQEEIKEALMGTKNPDGTRNRNNEVNLGSNGYFIIYNSKGEEVLHPELEGENAWDVTDARDASRKIVQEQIRNAKENPVIMTYSWYLPNSDKIGEKIAYGQYFKDWDWIVVATAYSKDFNSMAYLILNTSVAVILVLLIIIIFFMNIYLKFLTNPITKVVVGMGELENGTYSSINSNHSGDEIDRLVNGYNQMIQYLQDADSNIRSKAEQITFLAYHDDMTRLSNFYGMEYHVMNRIRKEMEAGVLVLVNVRGLNVINAIMGYDKGNVLLREIGSFFLERSDMFYSARTSSNEFGLWLSEKPAEPLEQWLQTLKKELRKYVAFLGYGQSADFCFSVACCPEHGTGFEELYEKATLAMKLIKDTQGIDSGIYEDSMRTEMEEKMALGTELLSVFEKEEIIPYYQEKTDYTTGKVVGVEALARWKSPIRGMVGPGWFLPEIQARNLTNKFTAYMIRRTLKDYRKLCEKYGAEIDLSINVTPSSFLDTNMFEIVEKGLKEYQVPSGHLVLEITEDIFISDLTEVKEITDRFHKIGVRISIDDFGTGYSSLNYLTRIDFDELKIDKTFIDRILTDEKVYELVCIFCEIARVCGYKIVAEGVESAEQLNKLKDTDLKVIQGYLFSKPAPLN